MHVALYLTYFETHKLFQATLVYKEIQKRKMDKAIDSKREPTFYTIIIANKEFNM